MHRVAIVLAIQVCLLINTDNLCAQEEIPPARLLDQVSVLAGQWTTTTPLPDLPRGKLVLEVRPSLDQSFLQMRATFFPQNREPFELFLIAAHAHSESRKVRYHALHFDGQQEGEVTVENGQIMFSGNGVRFNGEAISQMMVFHRQNGTLTMDLTMVRDDEVFEYQVVMRPLESASESKSETKADPHTQSLTLAKELRGTWRLDQGNGRYTLKTVEGLTTKLTRYDADGNVTHAHETEFELSECNGVRFQHSKKKTITGGPDKGLVVPSAFLDGFIYKIEGDTLIEAQGLKAGERKARTYRWKRVEEVEK